ncbi:mitotic checkpoint protein [Moniliophthora roreri]|nr:mitotic checkpoint protein [Moniliophthora roreri]
MGSRCGMGLVLIGATASGARGYYSFTLLLHDSWRACPAFHSSISMFLG